MLNGYGIEIKRFIMLLRKLWADRKGSSNQVYFNGRVSEYRELWRAVATDINADFSVLGNDLWQIELNGKKARILNHQLEFDNPVTLIMAGRKPLVSDLLRQNNIPVAEHIVFGLKALTKGYDFLQKHPHGCVIKPANGSAGRGVTTHILSRREVRRASILASLYCADIIMEPMVAGESYRILVLDGRVIEVVKREGLWIKGDGMRSVQELVEEERTGPDNMKFAMFEADRDLRFNLQRQNLRLDSILPKNTDILLKSVNAPGGSRAEVRTVYNKKVKGPICDSIKEASEYTAKIVKSKFLGIDLIATDISVPLLDSGGVINEVNTTPALHHHYDPEKEKYPHVALEVISNLLEVEINPLP